MFFRPNKHGDLIALPGTTLNSKIQRVSTATLRISNKKTDIWGHVLIRRRLLARGGRATSRHWHSRVIHIRSHTFDQNTLLCAYWDNARRGNVTGRLICVLVKFAVNYLEYPQRGILLRRVDTIPFGLAEHAHWPKLGTRTAQYKKWNGGCLIPRHSKSIYNNNSRPFQRACCRL